MNIAPTAPITAPAPIAATTPAAPTAPTPGSASAPTPDALASLRTQLGALRTGAADALDAVRALDRTTPLTESSIAPVVTAGYTAVQALRAAIDTPGIGEDLQRAAAAAYPHLHDGIHLLKDIVTLGAPARTDVALDAVDLAFTRAWITAATLEQQLAAPAPQGT